MKYAFNLSLLGAFAAYGHNFRPTIQTSSGPVRGHPAHVKRDVSAYLNIPYAEPPVGPLRFMPPRKYNGSAIIDSSNIGFACPAVTFFAARGNDLNNYNLSLASLSAQGIATLSDFMQTKATFNEDCLTLNIWVPISSHHSEADKAVMIYIYGGSYTSGSTQIDEYDGQHLASEQDVIVVTLNYRVGILGFHGDPESSNHNPGYLDQRLAIEWVRDNIAAFGGDTSRMILFGQSAGAASVDAYAYSWASDPLVSGFIMESGTADFGDPLPPNHAKEWSDVSAALDCGANDTRTTLSCLQSKEIGELLSAIGDNKFGPSADNITAFSDYPALSRAGRFAKLPVLTGNNDFEAGIFIALNALVNQTMNHTYWEGVSNKSYACPAGARANVSASHNLPIWRYRWFGNFPNTRLFTNSDSGAYHGSEIPFVWDTLPRGSGIPRDTRAEISIKKYIQGAWSTFAKNASCGLDSYGGGWPHYSPFEPTMIRLAYDNITGTNVALPSIYDSTCSTTYPTVDTVGVKGKVVKL